LPMEQLTFLSEMALGSSTTWMSPLCRLFGADRPQDGQFYGIIIPTSPQGRIVSVPFFPAHTCRLPTCVPGWTMVQ
jgi:hypothetical protein